MDRQWLVRQARTAGQFPIAIVGIEPACAARAGGPCRTAAGGAIRHRRFRATALRGGGQRAEASAISIIPAAGNTGTPSIAWSASQGSTCSSRWLSHAGSGPALRKPSSGWSKGGLMMSGPSTVGSYQKCSRCERIERQAARVGGAVETRRGRQIVAGDMAACRNRRERVGVAVIARRGWRGRGPAPWPRAAPSLR